MKKITDSWREKCKLKNVYGKLAFQAFQMLIKLKTCVQCLRVYER